MEWLLCHDINFLNICVFVRKHEEEILQKPFQKDHHSKVAHRSLHCSELDRYITLVISYKENLSSQHIKMTIYRVKKHISV